jgi:23S rRNA pseudouridine1911/1915/1917 synthase
MNTGDRGALKILFEDRHLCVIDKPPAIHSAAAARSEHPSIALLLLKANPAAGRVSVKPNDAGLVNRLDFETSGCLLAAKTRDVWAALRSRLRDGQIEKTYLALLEGRVPKDQIVNSFIGSPYRRAKKVRCYARLPGSVGRFLPAQSRFERLAYCEQWDVSLVRVTAHTARRHQIRAHAGFIGHPLMGDVRYSSKRSLTEAVPEAGADRLFFLHAESLALTHPVTEARIVCRAPIPTIIAGIFPSFKL